MLLTNTTTAPTWLRARSKQPQQLLGTCGRVARPIRATRQGVAHADESSSSSSSMCRRALLAAMSLAVPVAAGGQQQAAWAASDAPSGLLNSYEPMTALKDKDYGKSRFIYPDYVQSPTGLQYKDLREGGGDAPKDGDTVVVDWGAYTIGYYGRPVEARNKPKGSSFTGEDKDFLRFQLGSHTMIPAFEEAISGMKVGGIRRIIVPLELGYPQDNWRKLGPKPTTFAGDRALDFVLSNRGMIDKTLLFDIELKNILR